MFCYENGWELVLYSMTEEDCNQTPVLSRLLCTSKAMAAVVHRACSGRVNVELISKHNPDDFLELFECNDAMEKEARAWRMWLTKHACLIKTLTINIWTEQEKDVAAGFKAAAAAAAAGAGRTTRQQARLAAAAQAGADTAGSGAQGLLIHEVVGLKALSPLMLRSIACSSLRDILTFASTNPKQRKQQAAALADLTSLRTLRITLTKPQDYPPIFQAVQRLTSLTRLDIFDPHSDVLQQQHINRLPASLVELCAGVNPVKRAHEPPPSCYTHLTALQRLAIVHADPSLALPPSTTHLEVHLCSDIAPVLQHDNLKSVRFWMSHLKPEALKQLADKTSLQELHLGHVTRSPQHAAEELELLNLPKLRSLEIIGGGLNRTALSHLGGFTQLTSLVIRGPQLHAEPNQLFICITKLKNLRYFALKMPSDICREPMWRQLEVSLMEAVLRFIAATLSHLDNNHDIDLKRNLYGPAPPYNLGVKPEWSLMGDTVHMHWVPILEELVVPAGESGSDSDEEAGSEGDEFESEGDELDSEGGDGFDPDVDGSLAEEEEEEEISE